MKRYSQIVSDTTDPTMLEGAYNLEGATDASAPPVLPSLLDACAPSAALTLSVYPEQGKPPAALSKILLTQAVAWRCSSVYYATYAVLHVLTVRQVLDVCKYAPSASASRSTSPASAASGLTDAL